MIKGHEQGKFETKEYPDNCVFIGKKPTMTYVFSVTTQAQNQKDIRIKARGRSISKAVDVSQIALHRFLNGWELNNVTVGTEEKESILSDSQEKKIGRVSYIELQLISK